MLKQEKNVLLLMANKRVSALTAKLLEVHGFACSQPATFTQALAAVGNGNVQVVLVDFGVEPDDGCRFAAEAEKLPGAVPVVVCDPEPSLAHAQRVRASKAFDYLSCPFVVTDLVNCLKRATALLASLRKPQVALEDYLKANGEESDDAAPDAAEEGSEVSEPTPSAVSQTGETARSEHVSRVLAAVNRDDLVRHEREWLVVLRSRGMVDAETEERAAEKLAQEAQRPDGTVSAMAALELVSEDAWERVAERVAADTKVFPVDFGAFPPDEKLIRTFDAALLRTFLAVPFAKLDSVTLVALPNPESTVRAAVAGAIGGECQFFTCSGLAAKAALERAFTPKKEVVQE